MRVAIGIALVGLGALVSITEADDIRDTRSYVLAPVSGDTTAPSAPTIVARVHESRSHEVYEPEDARAGDEIGAIELELSADDEGTAPRQLGYRVKLLGAPGGLLVVPDGERTVATSDGRIRLPFHGEDTFDVAFEVRAVDPSGNVGPPATVRVHVKGEFPIWIGVAVGAVAVGLTLAITFVVMRHKRRRAR